MRVLVGQDDTGSEHVLYRLGLIVIVPLVALLATSGLLAPEIDDGSISYLLAKPISRHTIVASKLVVAVACVLVFGAVPMLVAGLILRADGPRSRSPSPSPRWSAVRRTARSSHCSRC